MDVFGSFSLILSFVCAVYAVVIGAIAIGNRHPYLLKSARQAAMACSLLVTISCSTLVYLFLTDDFSMAYVASHSSRELPTLYKFAALWSGQEGSLLFWSWLLSGYMFFVLLQNRGKHPELMPYVTVILASVQVFFLILNVFITNPFHVLGNMAADGTITVMARPDGRGLNPLLQYPEMAAHPPTLYLGFVGFTVPFAFALAALLGRYPGEKWIHITRRWTMTAWAFLGLGILMGAHWAYAVLGWGGYWGWDPVENASFIPWLTGTAFLHSVMMQEKRGMMKVWNVWLVFVTFLLCILGTMLTRSGIVSSVHAFAQSNVGPWFVGFLALATAACVFAYLKNRDYLKSDNQLDAIASRESSFLFNNLLFLAACFAVLWGTLFPVISEFFTNNKINVGPYYFNLVVVPIGLFLLFLTGVGPLLAWRKTSLDSLKRNFGWPLLGGVLAGVVAIPLGFRPWQDAPVFGAWMCLVLSVFVTLTILMEFGRGAAVIRSRSGQGYLDAVIQLTMRNTRRYGGYVVHFGMVLMFLGVSGKAFTQDLQMEMAAGAKMEIGPYTLVSQAFTSVPGRNYQAERATIEVLRDGKQVLILTPERRFYPTNDVTGTMVSIHSTLKEDLYVVYAGRSPDSQQPVIHAYVNPLVKWLWLGGIVMMVGTGLAMLPNRQPVLVVRTAAAPSPAVSVESTPHAVRVYEGHD